MRNAALALLFYLVAVEFFWKSFLNVLWFKTKWIKITRTGAIIAFCKILAGRITRHASPYIITSQTVLRSIFTNIEITRTAAIIENKLFCFR